MPVSRPVAPVLLRLQAHGDVFSAKVSDADSSKYAITFTKRADAEKAAAAGVELNGVKLTVAWDESAHPPPADHVSERKFAESDAAPVAEIATRPLDFAA